MSAQKTTQVDWAAMTDQEVWEALKAAPKVAGPWHVLNWCGGRDWVSGNAATNVYVQKPGNTWYWSCLADEKPDQHGDTELLAWSPIATHGTVNSKEEAMKAADEALRAHSVRLADG